MLMFVIIVQKEQRRNKMIKNKFQGGEKIK